MNLNDNSQLDENNLNYLNEEISNYDIFEDDSPRFKTDNYLSKPKQTESEYFNPSNYEKPL